MGYCPHFLMCKRNSFVALDVQQQLAADTSAPHRPPADVNGAWIEPSLCVRTVQVTFGAPSLTVGGGEFEYIAPRS